jgi:hypothetical protein
MNRFNNKHIPPQVEAASGIYTFTVTVEGAELNDILMGATLSDALEGAMLKGDGCW